MILDSIKNSERYTDYHPLFEKAFNFLKSIGDISLLGNRIEIEGNSLFAIKVCDKGRGKTDSPLESHRKYIDIQYTVSGKTLSAGSLSRMKPPAAATVTKKISSFLMACRTSGSVTSREPS